MVLAVSVFAGNGTAKAEESSVSNRGTTAGQLQPDQFLPELSKSELETVRNIVRVELTDAEPGTEVEWAHSDTGNSGVVILRSVTITEDMECREVTHVIRMAGGSDTQAYMLSSCLRPDGTWMYVF